MPSKYWIFYDIDLKLQSVPMNQEDAQYMIMKLHPQNVARYFVWTPGWENWVALGAYLESDQKNFVSVFQVPVHAPRVPTTTKEQPVDDEVTRGYTVTNFANQTTKGKINEEHTTTSTEATQTKEVMFNAHQKPAGKSKKISSKDDIELDNLMFSDQTISRIIKTDSSTPTIELKITEAPKTDLDFSMVAGKKLKSRAVRHDLQLEILLISRKGKEFRCKSVNISTSGVLLEEEIPLDFYQGPFDLLVLNKSTKDPKLASVKLEGRAVGGFRGKTPRQLQFREPSDLQIQSLKNLLDDYLKLEKTPKTLFTKVS